MDKYWVLPEYCHMTRSAHDPNMPEAHVKDDLELCLIVLLVDVSGPGRTRK